MAASSDLRARYASDRWSASLGVDNVGDEEYWAFHPYTRRNFIAELGVVLLEWYIYNRRVYL